MSKVREAIIEFYDEVMLTVRGSRNQTNDINELMVMIEENIEADKNNMLCKYGDEE